MDRVFEPEVAMAMGGNLILMPQVCLILRNVIEYTPKIDFLKFNKAFSIFLVLSSGVIIRYLIKTILLKEGIKRVLGKRSTSNNVPKSL